MLLEQETAAEICGTLVGAEEPVAVSRSMIRTRRSTGSPGWYASTSCLGGSASPSNAKRVVGVSNPCCSHRLRAASIS
jgi:hypothetical protein